MHGQLGFCQGNSGDPIFTETFGSGLQNTSLPAGTTTYTYATGQDPEDGFYTVSSTSNYFDWFNINDHTLNDTNGRMLIVNSSYTAGEFYKTTISGLCENTTYEFSSWLINLTPPNGYCGAGAIPINVSFEIWDNTDTTLLASGTTGNIYGTTATDWNQYALVFQSTVGQTSVILKMINNAPGGCGNDLAIDDIVFKSCGDAIAIEDNNNVNSITLCSTQNPNVNTIEVIPDNSVFSSHYYQWQISTDNINWTDIAGETTSSIAVLGISTTTYYRAKVAEYAANLNNLDCITFSDVYEIIIIQAPEEPATNCWEEASFSDTTCSWTVTGTQPEAPTGLECWQNATFNTASCEWEIEGTQPEEPTDLECWEEATFSDTTCSWTVTGTQPEAPTGLECWQNATFNTTSCEWEIEGTQPEEPIDLECWEEATFSNTTCSWTITGAQPEAPTGLGCWQNTIFNTASCEWEIEGIQPEEPTNLECWELAWFNTDLCDWEIEGAEPIEPTDLLCWQSSIFNEETCEWEIIGNQPLELRDEYLVLCYNNVLVLQATSNIEDPSYLWESGEMSQSITIDMEGIYEVKVTDGCFTEIITFNVSLEEVPIIESVKTDGSSIIINVLEPNNYLYSLNGIDYQLSNIFSNQQGGLYTIYVKTFECEIVTTIEHLHFFIQKFITPNGDGTNDVFKLNIAEFFTNTEVYIYDRYGKLLYSAINRNALWNGDFNGNDLPTSDYWYRIVLDGKEFQGHFSLKR
ncbi:T9SS type B sorting domain-containing protein [Winogradskyella litoriviva]|uniref:T9SS type B sorting domain-containing protein n=1 Tax=Winogradskyella litoriviva TaxID=1220182 RepID=A0ABX2E865_9FLAO|nr:T9SS type B sorting domain-containing protein [Winogradskyella litoriviva]NRD24504.1 T9SS type B sorting domain-containing protein [Winogradskyella litoriviva]